MSSDPAAVFAALMKSQVETLGRLRAVEQLTMCAILEGLIGRDDPLDAIGRLRARALDQQPLDKLPEAFREALEQMLARLEVEAMRERGVDRS